ncbi:WYL domain-containing protein, partial [Clostridioides difficile]
PYGLFNYKSDTYMVAFCEKRFKFIDFKLCR